VFLADNANTSSGVSIPDSPARPYRHIHFCHCLGFGGVGGWEVYGMS
jgi:hypothetical protein